MHIHNYRTIQDTTRATVEVCTECKKKLITKMDKKGRIDNKTYREEHERDLLQPTGKTKQNFDRFYGKI